MFKRKKSHSNSQPEAQNDDDNVPLDQTTDEKQENCTDLKDLNQQDVNININLLNIKDIQNNLNKALPMMEDFKKSSENGLKTLQKFAEALPLSSRKETSTEKKKVKALCDITSDNKKSTLSNKKQSLEEKDSDGNTLTVTPDSLSDSFMSFQHNFKQKLANTKKALQLPNLKKGGSQTDGKQHQQYQQLRALLREVAKDLDAQKKASQNQTTPELEQDQPITNNNRLENMKSILDGMSFGEDFESISQELEDHNIFQKKLEALASRITQEKNSSNDLQTNYNNLLESSKVHQKNLLSLKDYVERCDKELELLSQEINERIEYDWRNDNPDNQKRPKHYESTNNSKINDLENQGRELITQDHPGQNIIQAYINKVNRCWQDLLVILKCEEAHLTNIQQQNQVSNQQKEFQAECTEIDKLLKQQETKLKDMKDIKDVTNDEDEYRLYRALTIMTDVEKTMEAMENRIKKLQQLSFQFTPLSDHRTPPQEDQTVMALCDVATETINIVKGRCYTLMSINNHHWDVKDSAGNVMTAPAIYFSVADQARSITDRPVRMKSQWRSINEQIPEIKKKLTSHLDNLRKDDTGVYSEPEIIKGKIFAVKMEMEHKCNICNYIQKQFSMKEDKYKCENEKCKFRQDSHKFIIFDGFIKMKVNNKDISKMVPTPVVKGYLMENNLEHLLKDNRKLEEHFMDDSGFEIMYDKFKENKPSKGKKKQT